MENDKKFCINCGNELSLTSKFCGRCGHKVEVQEQKNEELLNAEALNENPVSEINAEAEDAVETSEQIINENLETNKAAEEQSAVNELAEESVKTEDAQPEAQPETSEFGRVFPQTEDVIDVKKAKKTKSGIGVFPCIVLMVLAVLISIAGTLLLLKLSGYLDKTSRYSNIDHKPIDHGSTIVDGHEVKAGDNVTINVSGTENMATAVYAKCAKSVVGIRVVYEKSPTPWSQSSIVTAGEGSGVVYMSDGYILTNNHVIESTLDADGTQKAGYSVLVFLDKSLSDPYTAQVIGRDVVTDLALLKIDATGLTPIEFADEKEFEIGETVFSIGSPGGLEFMNSICDGIISGIGRNIMMEDGYAYDLIQTTAAINPGNSGGALLTSSGKLVGICALKIASSSYDDMCFAISCGTVSQVASALKEYGKVERPQLGVSINTNYNASEAAASGLPAGAWISAVTKGGPAEKAGITVNSIITAIDDSAVTDYTSLRSELLKHKIGETVKVTVYEYNESKKTKDGGEYKTYNVILESAD